MAIKWWNCKLVEWRGGLLSCPVWFSFGSALVSSFNFQVLNDCEGFVVLSCCFVFANAFIYCLINNIFHAHQKLRGFHQSFQFIQICANMFSGLGYVYSLPLHCNLLHQHENKPTLQLQSLLKRHTTSNYTLHDSFYWCILIVRMIHLYNNENLW